MKNILIFSVLALALCFASCKPDDDDNTDDTVMKSVIKGKVTYEETETGDEGNAAGAIVKLHKGSEQDKLKEVTADGSGNYQITGIIVDKTDAAKIVYQLSATFSKTFGGTPVNFTGRSDSITIKGNDTIICNLHMIN
jgi:hypothetical protein